MNIQTEVTRRRRAKVAQIEMNAQKIASDASASKNLTDRYCAPREPHQLTVQEAVAVWQNEGDPN